MNDAERWETPDGESPSRLGCFNLILYILLIVVAVLIMLVYTALS